MYEMIPPLLAVFTAFGLGAMGLVGLRIWVSQKRGPDVNELVDVVREQLREDVRDEIDRALEARQSEIDELHDRLEFAERMLSQARLPKGIEGDGGTC